MKRKEILHIKIDQTKLRDLNHFETQLHNKSITFKPKKGKGSYTRKEKHKETY